MFERFTDRARRVIELAQTEARRLQDGYVGTEHILLGLVHEGEGVAAKALESMGIGLDAVRQQVEETVGQGQQAPSGHIPFTPRAKKVLELSLREALQLGHNYIGTEHLLLGLLREGEGVAAQVLVKLGADLTTVRRQVVQLLGGEGQFEQAQGSARDVEQLTSHTLLSVRGEAQRTVAADQASIFVSVSATRDTKRAATSDVADALARVTADLADLGGEVLTAQTAHAPLTWSTHSMRTVEEHAHDKTTGVYGPTGRHHSSVDLLITVRDFTLLDRVQSVLTDDDRVDVHSVRWSVDGDNPEWALVRADAIHAALLKGQDYASALGGSVIGVEHVADAGLLGGDARAGIAHETSSFGLSAGGDSEIASLDPVPQVLSAMIDARLAAVIGPVPTR